MVGPSEQLKVHKRTKFFFQFFVVGLSVGENNIFGKLTGDAEVDRRMACFFNYRAILGTK